MGVSLYYVVQNTIPYLSSDVPLDNRHSGHGAWLVLHIVSGIVALLAGPLQFSAAVRRRYLAVHRWTGRIYLVSVARQRRVRDPRPGAAAGSFGFRIGSPAWPWRRSRRRPCLCGHPHAPDHAARESMIRSSSSRSGSWFFRLLLDPLRVARIATRPRWSARSAGCAGPCRSSSPR